MKAIVMVYDSRTFNGFNTRSKIVKNETDAKAWALKIKNRVFNHVTTIENGKAHAITL